MTPRKPGTSESGRFNQHTAPEVTREYILQRLFRRVIYRPGDCWGWKGGKWAGYGRISIAGEGRLAHRLMFEATFRALAPAEQVDHLCRTEECICPAHLEAVTSQVNVLRGTSPFAKLARRESCDCGLAFSIKPDGYRVCMPCRRRRAADHTKKLREEQSERGERFRARRLRYNDELREKRARLRGQGEVTLG